MEASINNFSKLFQFQIWGLSRLDSKTNVCKKFDFQRIPATIYVWRIFPTILADECGKRIKNQPSATILQRYYGLVTEVFDLFMAELQNKGYIMNEGKMVDASFTTAPRQRNTLDENKAIKEGHGKELRSDQPSKQRQKDVDARWTQKHDVAYASEQLDEVVKRCKMINRIHQKGYRNRPLTDDQKKSNALKSKTRARVEHVYAFMEQSMHGLMIRCVGMDRAKGVIGLINRTYNMFRQEQIERLKLTAFWARDKIFRYLYPLFWNRVLKDLGFETGTTWNEVINRGLQKWNFDSYGLPLNNHYIQC